MNKIGALLAVLLLSFAPVRAFSLEDTPANRQSQIDRYLAALPAEEMFQDMADKLAVQIPDERREQFKAAMTRNMDVKALIKATSEAMAKHFTADEVAALADFYSSPIAKSAMKKFGTYMAEVMPALQTEMAKAIRKTNAEFGISK